MFSAFEWMVAGRYLRARRQEGFVSVIAGFSFLGIALTFATPFSTRYSLTLRPSYFISEVMGP